MEKTKKYTIVRTRNSEFERYENDVKILYLKYGSICKYLGQHESADALEKRLKRHIQEYGRPVPASFDIRTGTGIVVEYGTVY